MSVAIPLDVVFYLGVFCMALMCLANGHEEAQAKGFIVTKEGDWDFTSGEIIGLLILLGFAVMWRLRQLGEDYMRRQAQNLRGIRPRRPASRQALFQALRKLRMGVPSR